MKMRVLIPITLLAVLAMPACGALKQTDDAAYDAKIVQVEKQVADLKAEAAKSATVASEASAALRRVQEAAATMPADDPRRGESASLIAALKEVVLDATEAKRAYEAQAQAATQAIAQARDAPLTKPPVDLSAIGAAVQGAAAPTPLAPYAAAVGWLLAVAGGIWARLKTNDAKAKAEAALELAGSIEAAKAINKDFASAFETIKPLLDQYQSAQAKAFVNQAQGRIG